MVVTVDIIISVTGSNRLLVVQLVIAVAPPVMAEGGMKQLEFTYQVPTYISAVIFTFIEVPSLNMVVTCLLPRFTLAISCSINITHTSFNRQGFYVSVVDMAFVV